MENRKVKRKKQLADLPLCKYGSLCYQKSAEHHSKFSHPYLVEKQNKGNSLVVPDAQDILATIPTKRGRSRSPKRQCSPFQSRNSRKSSSRSPKPSPAKIKTQSKSEVEVINTSKTEVEEEEEAVVIDPQIQETVKDVLNSMPKDFFDFWDFCSTVNKSKPEDAFSDLGIHLVGTYDLLSRKLPKKQNVRLHCHWRYFYDPPEFQTVIKFDGEDLYHIGYFRDDPSEKPSILASNSAAKGCKITLKGDNIFAALISELTIIIKKLKANQKSKFSKILEDMKEYAKKKKYSLEIQSAKTKARNKKVVAKTFNGIGIVVPVKNSIGYRELPDSDATIYSLLKRIIKVEDLDKRLEVEEGLDELITNVQFANDECDYGMGLELAIDLFSFGDTYFHRSILHLLPLAYDLLKRPKYADIIRCHLANRRKSDELDDLTQLK